MTHRLGSIYTWSPNIIPKAKDLGLENMAMLWGFNQVTEFQKLVKKGYATAAMGMNE
jgi:hypothetical protein